MTFWSWLRVLLSGKPHFVIGGPESPYLLRWYLVPRNRRFNLYLHKFLRSDDDRALHDHPWWFWSLLLRGQYLEHTPTGAKRRGVLSLAFRRAEHRHRVELTHGQCWTLVLTGPKRRTWGFWCPQGFVRWDIFTKPGKPGEVGRGCDA